MHLSSTGGHGRGDQSGTVIGDVINHGKRQFWGVPGMHYHQGMAAGENTLNALCARLVTRTITSSKGAYDPDTFLRNYVDFMYGAFVFSATQHATSGPHLARTTTRTPSRFTETFSPTGLVAYHPPDAPRCV